MAEQGPFRLSVGAGGVSGPTLYSNNVQILLSTWDFTFEFSQLMLTPNQQEGGAPLASTVGTQRILMSPQHAKAFSEILRQNVAEWERAFGEIQVPPSSANPPQ